MHQFFFIKWGSFITICDNFITIRCLLQNALLHSVAASVILQRNCSENAFDDMENTFNCTQKF